MEPLTMSLGSSRNGVGAVSFSRREFCRISSLSTLAWLSAGAMTLADSVPRNKRKRHKAMILLWLKGGPSQFETFDPHPGIAAGGPTKALATAVPGIELAEGLPRVAEQMESIALVRSMVGKEGDHGRGRYLMKTGYRPNPTVIHPSIGAICAAQLPVAETEVPRYVSIRSSDEFSRGGYLGEAYDPFRIGDPSRPLPDVIARVGDERLKRRLEGLDVVEGALARRNPKFEARTLHRDQVRRSLKMMNSEQLGAFEIDREPASVRERYGETPFGRGCLCARRLVEVGVRCIEVELPGWDTHANNFTGHATQNAILDPAFAALIADLRERDLLETTLVVCAGEFGRTPRINPLDGRDHWPEGFSLALAGSGIRGGQVIGASDPLGKQKPKDPVTVADLHATVLTALGIDPETEILTSIGRPMRLSEGAPAPKLLDN